MIMMLNTAIFSWFLINVMVMASHPNLRRSENSFALSDTGKVSRLMLFSKIKRGVYLFLLIFSEIKIFAVIVYILM